MSAYYDAGGSERDGDWAIEWCVKGFNSLLIVRQGSKGALA